MTTLTVRNLDQDIVRRLRLRAAENGRSAEAEHREILRSAPAGGERTPTRGQVAERLAEFRRRTVGRGFATAELLQEARTGRTQDLAALGGRSAGGIGAAPRSGGADADSYLGFGHLGAIMRRGRGRK